MLLATRALQDYPYSRVEVILAPSCHRGSRARRSNIDRLLIPLVSWIWARVTGPRAKHVKYVKLVSFISIHFYSFFSSSFILVLVPGTFYLFLPQSLVSRVLEPLSAKQLRSCMSISMPVAMVLIKIMKPMQVSNAWRGFWSKGLAAAAKFQNFPPQQANHLSATLPQQCQAMAPMRGVLPRCLPSPVPVKRGQ